MIADGPSSRGANNKPSCLAATMHEGQPPAPTRASAGRPTSVYPPRDDTYLLLEFASVPPGTRVLEVGTGGGLASLAAARGGARVVATDLNPEALRRLRANARRERLDVQPVRTDLARGLGRFDRVLSNPPYLPTRPKERDPDRWTNLALDGGPDGTRTLARLLDELPAHLAPGGDAYVVVSSEQDPRALARLRRAWQSAGGQLSVAASRQLEGERLEVWRLTRAAPRRKRPWTRRAARRSGARTPGTGGRPRTLGAARPETNRAPGRGRTPVRDGASVRRRSRRGW